MMNCTNQTVDVINDILIISSKVYFLGKVEKKVISLFGKPKLYRHGDLLIKQIDQIPLMAKPLSTNIIAEGEITGHNHKLYGSQQVYGTHSDKNFRIIEPTYFQAKEEISLKHQEHDTLKISKGNYVILHEREHDPFNIVEIKVQD